MIPFDVGKIKVFDILHVAVSQNVALRDLAFLRNHAEVSTFVDDVSRRLVMRLASKVLAKEVKQEEGSTTVPADWWSHFKQRWFPKWALRRWPSKTVKIVTMRVYRCCPHDDVMAMSNQSHFEWLEYGRIRDDWD